MRALLIPEGFAHGYQTLSDNVELLYCHSNFFNEESEGGLNPKIKLSINWPIGNNYYFDKRFPIIH